MQTNKRDVFGFSAEARTGTTVLRERVCIKLLTHFSLEHGATGWQDAPTEAIDAHDAVARGEFPCPIRHECRKYAKAVAAGKHFVWDRPDDEQMQPKKPRQLELF